jgi:NADPH:quinone reductase-like Zn-dependent oxidoreductase
MVASIQSGSTAHDSKNHRVVVTEHGGPEVLQVVVEDPPEPDQGEARVRVLTAGVSAYDLMHRRSGSLPGVPPLPYTPGEDIAGVVDKLGQGVTSLEEGQLVAGLPRGGGYAEFVIGPALRSLRTGSRGVAGGQELPLTGLARGMQRSKQPAAPGSPR